MTVKFMKNWCFSFTLLVIYLGTFHIWHAFHNRFVFILSGIVSVFLAFFLLHRAKKKNYFLSKVDLSIHIIVILDIAIEAFIFEIAKLLFLPVRGDYIRLFHSNLGFYFCALAFALVIYFYRRNLLLKAKVKS